MVFSNEVTDKAWERSGGKCECTRPGHGHTGRCNQSLLKTAKGKEASSYGWTFISVSGLFKKEVDDCKVYCTKCAEAFTKTPPAKMRPAVKSVKPPIRPTKK